MTQGVLGNLNHLLLNKYVKRQIYSTGGGGISLSVLGKGEMDKAGRYSHGQIDERGDG